MQKPRIRNDLRQRETKAILGINLFLLEKCGTRTALLMRVVSDT